MDGGKVLLDTLKLNSTNFSESEGNNVTKAFSKELIQTTLNNPYAETSFVRTTAFDRLLLINTNNSQQDSCSSMSNLSSSSTSSNRLLGVVALSKSPPPTGPLAELTNHVNKEFPKKKSIQLELDLASLLYYVEKPCLYDKVCSVLIKEWIMNEVGKRHYTDFMKKNVRATLKALGFDTEFKMFSSRCTTLKTFLNTWTFPNGFEEYFYDWIKDHQKPLRWLLSHDKSGISRGEGLLLDSIKAHESTIEKSDLCDLCRSHYPVPVGQEFFIDSKYKSYVQAFFNVHQ